MGPRRPRPETSGAKATRAGTRASGVKRGGPPKRGPARRPAPASRSGLAELERLHARRLRACRSLGIPIPSEAASGPPESLLQRIAHLDRRIEVSLDLAGGRHFPPWNDPDEEDPDPEWEDPDPEDPGAADPDDATQDAAAPDRGDPHPRDDGGEGQPAESSS